jgi:hypothetical protein
MRAGTPEGEVLLGLIGAARKRREDARAAEMEEAEKKQLKEAFARIERAKRRGVE